MEAGFLQLVDICFSYTQSKILAITKAVCAVSKYYLQETRFQLLERADLHV